MVIIMIGISACKPSRLYISRYECKIDEGLDVYNRKKAEEERKEAEKIRKDWINEKFEQLKKFASSKGFTINIDVDKFEAIKDHHYDCYPIEMKRIPDEFYPELKSFVMDKSLNEKGDGWSCLSDDQSLTRDLILVLYYGEER